MLIPLIHAYSRTVRVYSYSSDYTGHGVNILTRVVSVMVVPELAQSVLNMERKLRLPA